MSVAELQRQSCVTDDVYMTKKYLNLTQFASRLGVTTGALNSQGNLPAPDVLVGPEDGPRPTRGWSEETIDTWNASRRGPGNWGPKVAEKKSKK